MKGPKYNSSNQNQGTQTNESLNLRHGDGFGLNCWNLLWCRFAQNFKQDLLHQQLWSLGLAGRFVEVPAPRWRHDLSFGLVRSPGRGRASRLRLDGKFSIRPMPLRAAPIGGCGVIRLPSESIPRAGEETLALGGFGLVVLDLGGGDIPMPLQTRLTGLALHHHTALVCLTTKERKLFSLGSLVSLRVHAEKKRYSGNIFACSLQVLKDKRRGPVWNYEERYVGPAGLC
jgi:hypothetical protein